VLLQSTGQRAVEIADRPCIRRGIGRNGHLADDTTIF
jgi:hypothetical protein